jgi:hypothetical protein
VELRNSNNQPTITLDASGNSRFDGAMTIGAAGGIWQGLTGTFAAPRKAAQAMEQRRRRRVGRVQCRTRPSTTARARFDKRRVDTGETTLFWKPENSVKWARANGTIFGVVTATEVPGGVEKAIEIGLNPIYDQWYATGIGVRIGQFNNDPNDTYVDLFAKTINAAGDFLVTGQSRMDGA